MTHPNLIFYRAKAKYFRNKSAFGSFFSALLFYRNQTLDIYNQTLPI